MKVNAVIPAAGRGSRLGLDCPKVLAPLGEDAVVLDLLRGRLAGQVRAIHYVLAPDVEALVSLHPGETVDIQPVPVGMGDAIFRTAHRWREADRILVLWGDQAGVSRDTVSRAVAHSRVVDLPGHVALPLVELDEPYVDYVFEDGQLVTVSLSREGDRCRARGWSDVGLFVLTTPGLVEEWEAFVSATPPAGVTAEVNFISFLPYLASRGWRVDVIPVDDPAEARGINTPDDLAVARDRWAAEQEQA